VTRLVGETEAALVGNPTTGDLRELLAQHAETYRSMSSMIDDTLDLLRTGGSEGALARAAERLDRIVEEVVGDFGAVAEERGVDIAFKTPGEIVVPCDPATVKRALANLLDNAIRHTAPGGRVDVAVQDLGHSVEIVVRDTGDGIPEAEIGRIFERFFRGEKARASGAHGFGLGLSIVQRIAEQHGGSVSVTSTEGVGSEFRLRLPSARRT
jgi:signal transduction histidine kinase